MSNLSNSSIERQNVLNNRLAVEEIQKSLKFPGMLFEGEFRYTKKMVAEFYGVDVSSVDRYITQYSDELKHNGYVLLSGNALKELKLQFGHLIDKVTKTTKQGLLLLKNGYTRVALSFMKLMEAHIYHVAAGYISKELLARIVERYVDGQGLDEEIKVALMAAMSHGIPDNVDSTFND